MKIVKILGIVLLGTIGIYSCGKKVDNTTPKVVTEPSDQLGSAESGEAMEDVRDVINNGLGGGSGVRVDKSEAYNLPCGVVSIDSNSTNIGGKKVYKLNYGSSTPCGYKYKSGQVNFELISGSKFSDSLAAYKVTFVNYTVKVNATGNTVKLNGTCIATNNTGGYIYEAITKNRTITHKIRGSYTVVVNDTLSRPRQVFEKRTWSSTNGWLGLTYTAEGDTLTATSGTAKVSEIGKTFKNQYSFETQISTPFVWSNCGTSYKGPYVLKTGNAKVVLAVPLITAFYQVEAGYYKNVNNPNLVPTKVSDCSSNAYKIDVQIGPNFSTEYQLY